MARTTITKTALPGIYSQTGQALTVTAADTVNQNDAASDDEMLLIAHNTNAGAQTVTINSVADAKTGRTGNVAAQSLAAGEIRIFNLKKDGWDNSDKLEFEASHADVFFALVTLKDYSA